LLLVQVWRWSRLQSVRQRLPAMLHRGFAWLGVALLLSALERRFEQGGQQLHGVAATDRYGRTGGAELPQRTVPLRRLARSFSVRRLPMG
jgi:hypothetical protein